MGIVVLILLVLSLELSRRQLQSSSARQAMVRQQVTATLTDVRAQVEALQAQPELSPELQLASFTPTELAARETSAKASADQVRRQTVAAAALIARSQKELLQLQQRIADERADPDRVQLESDSEELSAELKAVEDPGRVIYRTSPGEKRQAWLIELAAEAFTLAPIDKSASAARFTQGDQAVRQRELVQAIDTLSPQTTILHLLVKPGGTKAFTELEPLLRKRGFGVGFDLLGRRQHGIEVKP